ncbi:MAG: DUF3313 family protein [Halieaceae bacterium]|jgi:hypothetical protein|nr:DUF3313 family protein [Halieaceae bacterium]
MDKKTPAVLHTLLMITLLLLAACSSTDTLEFNEDDAIADRLFRVTNAQVALAYVDPDAEFGRYNKVMLDPLDTRNTVIRQPSRTGSVTGNKPFELNEQNRDSLAEAYRAAFIKELSETGDYEVVDAPGPDVLRVVSTLNEIAPLASKDDNRSRPVGRSRVYTEGAGAMAITFAFADSETSEVLAIVKDQRQGSPTWGPNNAVSNMSDVRMIFSRWARMLRARLDILHGY